MISFYLLPYFILVGIVVIQIRFCNLLCKLVVQDHGLYHGHMQKVGGTALPPLHWVAVEAVEAQVLVKKSTPFMWLLYCCTKLGFFIGSATWPSARWAAAKRWFFPVKTQSA